MLDDKEKIGKYLPLTITCMLLMSLIHAQLFNLSSVYITAVSDGLGITKSEISLSFTIGIMSCIVTSMMIGRIIKPGIRKIMISSVIMAAVCALLYSFSLKPWHFYVISVVFGYCVVTAGSTTITILMNNCVPEKFRGRLLGISMCGSSMGSMVLTPIINTISENLNWRWTYRFLMVLILAIAVPMVCINIKNVSIQTETKKDRGAISGYIRQKSFWALFAVIILLGFVSMMFLSAGFSYFVDIGFPADKASFVLSFMFACMIAGKLFLGFLCDKLGNRKTITLAVFFHLLGYIFFFLAQKAHIFAYISAVVIGLGNGFPTICYPIFISDMVGKENYSKIGGTLFSGLYVGNCVSPSLVSVVYDKTGSYNPALIACIIIQIIAIPVLFFLYDKFKIRTPEEAKL